MSEQMPLIFVGHGSPMVALEDSQITRTWKAIAERIPRPKAILSISAHWYGDKSRIQTAAQPKQIYDMYGFPPELYRLKYEAAGDPELSASVRTLLGDELSVDDSWGIDHGTWSVLTHMYPKADVPVVQLSILMREPGETLLEIGRKLKPLREQGCLILGSGNIVHNLRQVEWDRSGGTEAADAFDDWVTQRILLQDQEALANYLSHPLAKYAAPTPDHFIPLLYILGARDKADKVELFNQIRQMGSLSMTSYLFES